MKMIKKVIKWYVHRVCKNNAFVPTGTIPVK